MVLFLMVMGNISILYRNRIGDASKKPVPFKRLPLGNLMGCMEMKKIYGGVQAGESGWILGPALLEAKLSDMG